MENGGGRLLRLRIVLSDEERAAGGRGLLDEALDAELTAWVKRTIGTPAAKDLADCNSRAKPSPPDELTRILQLGSVHDFPALKKAQRTAEREGAETAIWSLKREGILCVLRVSAVRFDLLFSGAGVGGSLRTSLPSGSTR